MIHGSILTTSNDRPPGSCGLGTSRELIKEWQDPREEHEPLGDDFHFEAGDLGLMQLHVNGSKREDNGDVPSVWIHPDHP